MKHSLICGSLAAALALSAATSHAGCANPLATARQGGPQRPATSMIARSGDEKFSKDENESRGIVGTWHVTYTAGGAPFGEAFIQWHSDGTEWENIDFPVLGGNLCMGSWKQVGKRRFFRNHIGWLFDNGKLTGYFTETETDEVSFDGNSYNGTNDSRIFDLKNNLLAEVQGTSDAKRIGP